MKLRSSAYFALLSCVSAVPLAARKRASSVAPSVTTAAAAIAAAALVVSCGGKKIESRVCDGPGSCGADLCVVGRCRPAAASPAPSDTRRVLLEPSDISVLARGAKGSEGSDGERARAMPEAIALGQKGSGGTVILLRFTSTWRDDSDVTSAFVVLDPVEGAPLARQAATVEVARILTAWDGATASVGRQPRLSLPEKAAVIRPRPPSPARIDVTRLVREWPKRLADDHGIALLIDGDDALGAAFSMGVTDGSGPRLEVYVR